MVQETAAFLPYHARTLLAREKKKTLKALRL